MSINAKLIGKRIKEVRTARKIPQMLLAEKCEVCDSYISYIECGRKKPSLEVIVKIAKELDTSVDSLLEGNQNTDSGVYEKELGELLSDCSPYEKRIIYETIVDFMNLPFEEQDRVAEKCVWQPLGEIRLIDNNGGSEK